MHSNSLFEFDSNCQNGNSQCRINNNPDNLEVKIPLGTLGARGTEFVVLSESNNKSTVVLLGPGPENSLGMIPGNLILSDGITSIDITKPGYEAMVTN